MRLLRWLSFWLVLALAPPFPQATAQKPASSGIEIAGRTVRCGNVRILTDRHLPSEGAAAPGLLILNPRMLSEQPDSVRLFVFHHECGHHNVGESELAADCWAVDRGVRDGWLDAKGLDAVCRSFEDAPETDTHPSGKRRCRNLDKCFATAVASLTAKKTAGAGAPASPAKKMSSPASTPRQRADPGRNRHLAFLRRGILRRGARHPDERPDRQAHCGHVGHAQRLPIAAAGRSLATARAVPSVRQLEPVTLGAPLAPRRLGCLRMSLATHAWEDDDLRTRCFDAVARLCASVPRTEVENHSHCVPLAEAMGPGLPHRTTRTQFSWRIMPFDCPRS